MPQTFCSFTEQPPPETFKAYLRSLLKWIGHLLIYWSFKTRDENHLKQHILQKQPLYYTTDGGADDRLGYYGWVIANSTTKLVEGYGRALGDPELMESSRAKSY
eukprot:10437636-Ditylum_brightwellii.AAC.1